MKKLRIAYAAVFVLLLLTEIYIALFVHDDFVRPYLGDVLVTILLCCLCRIVVPNGVRLLPLYVFLFATLVEVVQYLDVVELLGMQDNRLITTLVGATFSAMDLVCYAVGCLLFWGAEKAIVSLFCRSYCIT